MIFDRLFSVDRPFFDTVAIKSTQEFIEISFISGNFFLGKNDSKSLKNGPKMFFSYNFFSNLRNKYPQKRYPERWGLKLRQIIKND